MPRAERYNFTSRPVTVRTPVANIATNSKVLNTVRVAGKIAFVAGIAATAYDVGADINEGKFKSAGARAAVFGVAAGAAFIPIVGWGVAAGIGVADYVWGDEFYNWVEK